MTQNPDLKQAVTYCDRILLSTKFEAEQKIKSKLNKKREEN